MYTDLPKSSMLDFGAQKGDLLLVSTLRATFDDQDDFCNVLYPWQQFDNAVYTSANFYNDFSGSEALLSEPYPAPANSPAMSMASVDTTRSQIIEDHLWTPAGPNKVCDEPSRTTSPIPSKSQTASTSRVSTPTILPKPGSPSRITKAEIRQLREDRRREQNRAAQREFRARKEAKIKQATDQIAELEQRLKTLEKNNANLKEENIDLRFQLADAGLAEYSKTSGAKMQRGMTEEIRDKYSLQQSIRIVQSRPALAKRYGQCPPSEMCSLNSKEAIVMVLG